MNTFRNTSSENCVTLSITKHTCSNLWC